MLKGKEKKKKKCVLYAHFIEHIEGIIDGSTDVGIEVNGSRQQGAQGRRGTEAGHARAMSFLASGGRFQLSAAQCPWEEVGLLPFGTSTELKDKVEQVRG
jgi:hypothetical protein